MTGNRSHAALPGRRRWITIAAIAAILAIGAAVGGVGAALLLQNQRQPQPKVLTEATLEALPGWSGSTGQAIVEKAASGQRAVIVIVSESRPVAGYEEVWLISSDLKRLISIGVLSGQQGRFDIPADVNLKEYPIVDVSDEKLDGDPAHSGDSIVRGTLS
jgi:hypothetical protein